MRNLSWILAAILLTTAAVGCGDKKDDSESASKDGDSQSQNSNQDSDQNSDQNSDKKTGGTKKKVTDTSPKAPRTAGSGLDLSYVTSSHFVAAIIRPADLAADDALKAVPLDYLQDDPLTELNLKPQQVEQVVVLFDPDTFSHSSQPSLVLRLAAGVDATATIEKLTAANELNEIETKQHKGFTIHVNSFGPAVMGKDQLILICGSEDKLKAMLDAKNTESPNTESPLIEQLKQVESSRQVAIAFSMAPVREIVDELIEGSVFQLPAPAKPMVLAAKQIESGIIYFDLAADNLLEAQIDARDAEGGAVLLTALQGGVGMLKLLYPGLKAKLQEETPIVKEEVAKIGDQLVESLTVSGAGSNVSITVARPEGLTEAVVSAVQAAEEMQKAMVGVNNFKVLTIGFHTYHDIYKSFPPAANPSFFDEKGQPHLSWRVHLLPFIEQQVLADKFRYDEPWDSEHNIALLGEMPAIYKTTADPTKTTIMGFVSADPIAKGIAGLTPSRRGSGPLLRDFIDGTSNTALIVEFSPEEAMPWTKPVDYLYDPEKPLPKLGKPDEDFVIVAFADAAVVKVPKATDKKLWRALITRNGFKDEDVDFSTVRPR